MLWHIIQHINEFSSVSDLKVKTQDIHSYQPNFYAIYKGKKKYTMDISPFCIEGIPSSNPKSSLLLPKICLAGVPLPTRAYRWNISKWDQKFPKKINKFNTNESYNEEVNTKRKITLQKSTAGSRT